MTNLHTRLVLVALDFTAAQLDTDPTADAPDAVRRGLRAARMADPDGTIFADAVDAVRAETAGANRARTAHATLTARVAELTHPRVEHRTTGRTGRVSSIGGWNASYVEVTWDDNGRWTQEPVRLLRVLTNTPAAAA